eukprot:scaffold54107_cov30-Tisochrysis_lutea.AAC.6
MDEPHVADVSSLPNFRASSHDTSFRASVSNELNSLRIGDPMLREPLFSATLRASNAFHQSRRGVAPSMDEAQRGVHVVAQLHRLLLFLSEFACAIPAKDPLRVRRALGVRTQDRVELVLSAVHGNGQRQTRVARLIGVNEECMQHGLRGAKRACQPAALGERRFAHLLDGAEA